jgi:hypothetical protein
MHVILNIVRCERGHVDRALALGDKSSGGTAGRRRCILDATPARSSFNDNGREMLISRGAKDMTMIPDIQRMNERRQCWRRQCSCCHFGWIRWRRGRTFVVWGRRYCGHGHGDVGGCFGVSIPTLFRRAKRHVPTTDSFVGPISLHPATHSVHRLRIRVRCGPSLSKTS